jgi:hypothetical protein
LGERGSPHGDVYGQSFLTLAALDSKDSTEGCKLVSDMQNVGTFLEFDFGHSKNDPYSCRVRIFEDEPRAWHLEYGDDPTNTKITEINL